MKISRKKKKLIAKQLTKTSSDSFDDENNGFLPEETAAKVEEPIKSEDTVLESATTKGPCNTTIAAPSGDDFSCSSRPLLKRLKLSYLVFLLFPALAFSLYGNALDTNFVFDDEVNIELVPALRMTEISWDSIVLATTDGFLKKRPLANLTFALNYYFGQLSTRGYHIVNVLIHAINGILIYLLFTAAFKTPVLRKRYGPPGLIPLAAAVVWLVHPLQVQSVTYIVQRMNSMAAMFYLLGMLCYVKARMTASNKAKWTLFGFCFLSALLGLATKEIVASIPFSLLLLEFAFFQNFNLLWLKSNVTKIGALLVFFACIALWYLGKNPLNNILAPYEQLPYSALQRLMTEFRVVLFYLKQLALAHPSHLNLLHNVPVSTSMFQPITTLLSFLAIAGSMLGAIFVARREPLIFFAVFWYFGTLVIESSIINLEIIYEHRSYLPSTFVILAVITYGSRIITHSLTRRIVLIGMISILGFWTHSRNAVWADEIAFWQDCIDKNPKASRAYNDLANAYAMQGEKKTAVKIYYQGMHLNYNDWKMHYNLGVILDSLWETDKAIEQLTWVTRAKPNFADAHFRLGVIYARKEDYQKAVWHTKEALRLEPGLTKARSNLLSYQKWAEKGRTR